MHWQAVTGSVCYLCESFHVGVQAMRERDGRGALGSILDDIRNKLVDEGWFGRRPTEGRDDPLGRWAARPTILRGIGP